MKKRSVVLCLLCAFALLFFLLSGCEIGPNSIESLMRPPHAASGQALEKALNSILGSGYSLNVPQSGSYHTAVTTRDLNADGQEEAIVFYSRANDAIRLCILSQSGDSWQKLNDFAGDGNSVYSLDFADMNGDGCSEIFVSWYMFKDKTKKSITVYSASETQNQLAVTVCTTEPCDYYLLTDVKNSEEKQLFITFTDVSKTPIVSTFKRIALDVSGRISAASNLQMDPRIVRIESLSIDVPEGETHPRVFADALLSDNQMITDVFLWSEERNNYYSPFRQNDEGFDTVTQRSSALKCADVNNDGLIEIPLREKLTQSNEGEVVTGYLLVWCGVQGDQVVPQLYYAVNAAQDYRLFLPKEWNDQVFIRYANAAHWSFVNGSDEELFSVTVQETDAAESGSPDAAILDDTSVPGVTYYCRVTETGRDFGVTEELLRSYFEYYAGGNIN